MAAGRGRHFNSGLIFAKPIELLGQSILSLDGYHVGVDWVIGLFYDEASQAGQGALSHRIRLDEIKTALAQQLPQLEVAEQQLPQAVQHIQTLQKHSRSARDVKAATKGIATTRCQNSATTKYCSGIFSKSNNCKTKLQHNWMSN